jgi:hypothetical protein
MTLDAWLQSRVPPPPPALVERIRQALAAAQPPADAPTADVLLDAGERLLATLLGADHLTRNGALDLLTADALVTYAFEAAAAEPERIGNRARGAMTRLAALAAEAAP